MAVTPTALLTSQEGQLEAQTNIRNGQGNLSASSRGREAIVGSTCDLALDRLGIHIKVMIRCIFIYKDYNQVPIGQVVL